MSRLKGKTVLITGASVGIGAACAELFAQKGANLILCARRRDKLTNLATRLSSSYNVNCHVAVLDVRLSDAIKKAINDLPDNFKQIDVLINNAGLASGAEKVYEVEQADLDVMIDTNIKGVLQMINAVVPQMVERNEGHIINLGSTAGHATYPTATIYCATKFSVDAITRGLKMDLHGTKVRVSSVDPGSVETGFSEVRFKGDIERANAVYQGFEALTPYDVAEAIVFCAGRPSHVNISEVIMMSVDQSSATMINRQLD